MQLIGLIHLSVDTPIGASKIVSDGDLALKQTHPVLIDSITRSLYDIDPISGVNMEQFSIGELLENYHHRSGKSPRC